MREQVVTQVGRSPDVGTHVAAGRDRVLEDQLRMQLEEREEHGGHDTEHRGDLPEEMPEGVGVTRGPVVGRADLELEIVDRGVGDLLFFVGAGLEQVGHGGHHRAIRHRPHVVSS